MTEKERQQLARDLHYRICFLAPGVPHAEIRLEVNHGILPIIQKLMDKVKRRRAQGEIELANNRGVWRHNEQT